MPGYLEIDLVSHSGAAAAGEFIYTLDCVDIATGWVKRQVVMGKGQLGIVAALKEIEKRLPFPLCGIDSARGPTKKMTTRMWSRKTGPTCVNCWAGIVMTLEKP